MLRDDHLQTAADLIQARLEAGGTVRFVVPTASMVPFLRIGDTLIVRGVHATDLGLGDLVVARIGQSWRVHRLIACSTRNAERILITKGDHERRADEPWAAPEWVGVVDAIGPHDAERTVAHLGWHRWAQGLAVLSCWQWRLHRPGSPFWRRVLLKGLDLILYATANLGRRLIILFHGTRVQDPAE